MHLQQRCRLYQTAARAVLLPPDRCSQRSSRGGASWWLDPGGRCPAARPVEGEGKGAQEGNEPDVRCVRGRASGDGVVGDAKSALVVRLVQAHVHPSPVLLVPRLVGILSALLQHCRCDLVVDVLLQADQCNSAIA